MSILVNVDNFALAETHRMMRDLQKEAGVWIGSCTTGLRPRSTGRP